MLQTPDRADLCTYHTLMRKTCQGSLVTRRNFSSTFRKRKITPLHTLLYSE
jgi:hypothetical protein